MKRQFATKDILSVAISAFNLNNQRIERDSYKSEGTEVISNRQLIKEYTDGVKRLQTAVDGSADQVEELVSFLQQSELVQTLTGKTDNFLHQINELLAKEEITEREFGLIAWAPKLFTDLRKKQEAKMVSSHYERTSRYIGKPGDKIIINFTEIESRYVQSMNCYAVYGVDEVGNLVFYWAGTKEKIVRTGRIQGRVKKHAPDNYHGDARVTTINYVKAVE
jgi:hypothetical protein